MEGIFLEYENENELRTYPFAAGCVPPDDEDAAIPAGVFVDAALYPVNPRGVLYLSEISDRGTISVSDDTGVIMTGEQDGDAVEFYDMSEFGRHVGTMIASSEGALSELIDRGVLRSYARENTELSASCVFPVVVDGVESLDVGDSGHIAGVVSFSNGDSDAVRVSSAVRGDGRRTIRFDVLPRPDAAEMPSIRRIICVVDGQTPFRILRLAYNTVRVSLDNIDRDVVCDAAHRENQFEMADTCDCAPPPLPSKDFIPEAYQLEEVYIPPDDVPDGATFGPEGGIAEGADNAFFLVSSNEIGDYANPISITLEDGVVSPKTDSLKVEADGNSVEVKEKEFLDQITSKGVVMQVPGLSGGQT